MVSSPGAVAARRRTVRQAFVVSPARSGSTLLRYLLDTHDDIVSPPELNLAALLQHLVEVWTQAEIAVGMASAHEPTPASPSDEAFRRARRAVDQVMVRCANAAGASLYCDKSLTTIDHLGTVGRCYPRAPMLFLYRYPLDAIASGLEASRWGFNAYGFLPFVSASPGNHVAALGNWWIDRVSRMLKFEREFLGPRARIYYEVLCDDPAGTVRGLLEFLGLPADDSIVERAFAGSHGQGPGDYKIDFTGSISMDSIGKGSSLPENLTESQVERIDELLVELDYPELAAAWRGDLASLVGLRHTGQSSASSREIAQRLVRLLSRPLAAKLAETHHRRLPLEVVIGPPGSGPVERLLIGADGIATLLEDAGPQLNGHQVRCRGDVLLRVAAGEVSFGKAVHDGEIRVGSDRATGERTAAPLAQASLAALSAVLRAHVRPV